MRSFPLPVRIVAGLTVTAAEQARQLPGYLVGLPITVASQALQVSMRIQQQVTELAIKGDEVLADLRTPEEQPAWATFDEDEPSWQPRVVDPPEEEHSSVVADYDQLTLPQLRGKLRSLSEEELQRLLDHERAHRDRPEFRRMLSNRLERVRSNR